VPVAARPPAPAAFVDQSLSLMTQQREVTRWLVKGHSNKQIARDLDVGERTVKFCLAAIFRLLAAQNRTEAVVIANRLGR
jgi:DNA-binding NarL/FixJ family response regulator